MKTSQNGFAPLIMLLIVAGVLVVGGAGYWYYQSQNKAPELIGGQKDEHGCLGPAGYSWCEVKQKCLRVWEEPCEATSTAQASNSQALPVISSVSPTQIVLYGKTSGTKVTITGSNFDYVYPSKCQTSECSQQLHVFVMITDSNGHTGRAWEYPTPNPNGILTGVIPSKVWNGASAWWTVVPGQYSLSVSVEGRGTSNLVPITITN